MLDLAAAQATPAGNTGVERTGSGLQACIDWVRYVCTDMERFVPTLEHLGGSVDDWEFFEHGWYRYRKMARCGPFVVLYDGAQEGMGFCVELSGQACRALEADRWFRGWDWYLRGLLFEGPYMADRRSDVHLTRLDVALDDRRGVLDMDVIEGAVRERSYTCRSGHADIHHSARRGQEGQGRSVQIGSRQSSRVLRCYDKAVEQQAKGQAVEGPWVRVELESHDERAELLALLMVQRETLDVVAGCIREFVDFKEARSSDSNRRRWETVSWWSAFLAGWEKVRLTLSPIVRNLAKAKRWIEAQVIPLLSAVYEGYGRDYGMIRGFLSDGRARWRPRHERMVKDALQYRKVAF